jgi:cytoskeletal protein RodZ
MDDSIGAKLRQAREQRHLTLQQVSESTKVRTHYIEALENDDLSAISSTAQARGFLRIYAEYLGLTAGELLLFKSPSELTTSAQPVIASPDNSLTYPEESNPKNKIERQGLLANLLNRFTRRKENEQVNLSTAEVAAHDETTIPKTKESTVEILTISEPKPFVPAQSTEELPGISDSPVESPVLEIKAVQAEPVLATESTPTVKVSRKKSSRPRKSSIPIDEQNVVKKKEDEQP